VGVSRSTHISRRAFLTFGVAGAALLASSRCWRAQPRGSARLTTRVAPLKSPIAAGLHELRLASPRDALVYVPASRDSTKPAPLIVALHGATQDGRLMVTMLTSLADDIGAVLLAPDSRSTTWDAIGSGFGPDVEFIDRALGWVFERCDVNPARLVLSGFSDGATYALALGLANGDLFSRVLAFSPGFLIPIDQQRGRPAVCVSHGVKDSILPIDQCSRRIVPLLKQAGYSVRFNEFDGGHQMPPDVIKLAAEWMR
jgi:phospholipase/carboxylesterase